MVVQVIMGLIMVVDQFGVVVVVGLDMAQEVVLGTVELEELAGQLMVVMVQLVLLQVVVAAVVEELEPLVQVATVV